MENNLNSLDWTIIYLFLAATVAIGIGLSKKGGSSLTSFFVGGRNLPWYIAGTSMVATTFAADTPLWVAEQVGKSGISANWLWWNMLIGGMLTTFFFARLWRKAEVLTELEFISLRYSGLKADILRGFKSIYLGLFINAVIIGWVNVAMIKILSVTFGLDADTALKVVLGIMLLTTVYSSLSGLLGVAINDVMQFIIAMTGCILLAYYVLDVEQINGLSGLVNHPDLPTGALNFLPSIGSDSPGFSLTIGAFLSFVLVQWWAVYMPGAEPGGGGYITQRMSSAKNPKHAFLSTFFFQVAHYCLRPWPWIIVGLAALILYPDLDTQHKGDGFVMAINDHLPHGVKGLVLASFLGAYMSTISTQVNLGASYLINDCYKKYLKPGKTDKHYVGAARVATFILLIAAAIPAMLSQDISSLVSFLFSIGAGSGFVLIARWYWNRINAWSEITAVIAPALGYIVVTWGIVPSLSEAQQAWFGDQNIGLFVISGFTVVSCLVVTLLTPAESPEKLQAFNQKIHGSEAEKDSVVLLILCWLLSSALVYAVLLGIGYALFQQWTPLMYCGAVLLGSSAGLYLLLPKTKILAE